MDQDPLGWPLFFLVVIALWFALLQAMEAALRSLNLTKPKRPIQIEEPALSELTQLSRVCAQAPNSLGVVSFFLSTLFVALLGKTTFAPLHKALLGLIPGQEGIAVALSLLILAAAVVLVFLPLFAFLPRRLALKRPENTALKLHGVARISMALFFPLSFLVDKALRGFLLIAGIDPAQQEAEVTEDEIRMLVDVGEEKGAIEEAERDMIENVFEFNNMTAGDCMTHRTDIEAIWLDDDHEEVIRIIQSSGLSRFPVYERDLDDIKGTLTSRDYLLNSLKQKPLKLPELIRRARFVPETVKADVLFRDMQKNKYHMAVVVDEYGGTAGLVTMEDLLEEIVGNIYDEYDPLDQEGIIPLGDGALKVAGWLDIETFNDFTGLSLPMEEEYDTIGGLILSHLNVIPEDGSHPVVEASGLVFEVLEVADRRIEWVRVSPMKEEDNA